MSPGLHYSGEIENADLILPLDLPYTLICHENGVFRKHLPNRMKLKTRALRVSGNGKHFESGVSRIPSSN